MPDLVRSGSQPLILTRLSQYRAGPKYTFPSKAVRGPPISGCGGPMVDIRQLVDKTSRYHKIAHNISFGTAKRMGPMSKEAVKLPGPGQYTPPDDYSSKPYRNPVLVNPTKAGRDFPRLYFRRAAKEPGPGQYEVRGKDRKGEPTLSKSAQSMAGRHGWYYEQNKTQLGIPGPAAYNPKIVGVVDVHNVSFAKSNRPPIYRLSTKGQPGPGTYALKGTLQSGGFSFSKSRGHQTDKLQKTGLGPCCPQVTQFS